MPCCAWLVSATHTHDVLAAGVIPAEWGQLPYLVSHRAFQWLMSGLTELEAA